MATNSPQDAPLEALEPFDEHNRRLLGEVHPQTWENPTPDGRYHLVVVGAGTAGLVTAAIASSLGARVALVEKGLMGGDCLNVGCVPSKGVIGAARAWHAARRAHEDFGGPRVAAGDAAPGDFGFAMERMRRLRADISAIDGARRFRDELGVDVYLGHGRFIAGDALEVDGRRLEFRKAVVATGARAAAPPIDGLADVGYRTNETIFSLTELPRRLGVIGGGPIGCELGQSFARFGSEVTLFQQGAHVLSREDQDASELVERALRRDGVDLRCGTRVVSVARRGAAIVVTVEREDGSARDEIEVDELLVAAGRAPNVEDLGLEAAGVEYDRRGIDVDDRLRTSSSSVYAIGDVASAIKLTHLSDAHARMVVRNALFFGRQRVSDLVVPWCTYTSPEVAHVGYYADDAREAGYEVETLTIELADNDRARLEGEDEGFLRVHLKKGTDTILGGSLVAARAGDMVVPLALAATHGIGLSKFSDTIIPYPTQGEVYRRAGDMYNRRKLTPMAEKIFAWWFKLLS